MADDESPEQTRHSRRWAIAVVAPVLYVLSVGPTVWAISISQDLLSPVAAERIEATVQFVNPIMYAPLMWASERMPWFDQLLEWYVNLI